MDYELFYSKKHDETPRTELKFRYELNDVLPTQNGNKFTAAFKKGQLSFAKEDYFEAFDDVVLIGITDDKFSDCVAGKNI